MSKFMHPVMNLTIFVRFRSLVASYKNCTYRIYHYTPLCLGSLVTNLFHKKTWKIQSSKNEEDTQG